MITRVKVCGITRLEDALAATDAGAHALGFVFAESPRRVTPARAREIVAALPPFVAPVGVFVDESPESVAETARAAGLLAVQLHGAEPPEQARALRALCPARIIKAFRARDASILDEMAPYKECCDAFLLDAYAAGAAGGTGRTFDWELARMAQATGVPLILAGGLTPENVGRAVRVVRPFAVDVSSGVEIRPGVKDAGRIRAFLAAVRDADENGTAHY